MAALSASRFCRALLTALVAVAVPVSGAPIVTDPSLPIQLNARSLAYQKNTVVYRDISIRQGEVSIEAQQAEATGLEFENSEWRFTGDVRIRLPNGFINSHSATVTFASNQIAHAEMTGAPAEFEQRRTDPDQLARGRAGVIEYDVNRSTVTLREKAWLSDGSNEISSDTLVYDIAAQRVLGNPEGKDEGVSIIFHPRSQDRNKPPPAGTPR